MELRHLEYFVAVAEEQNFTRAAGRLHIVQSAVSSAVKSLERELGSPLLNRTSKRVELTDAGVALLPKARATLDAARDARDAVDEVRGGLRGTLRIGTMTSVSLFDIPALMGRYHQRYPGVDLQLTAASGGSRTLAEAVAEGAYDMAFASLPDPPPPGVATRELASDSLTLVVASGHRLAGQAEAPLADLAGETFVDFPVGYGNRVVVDRAFATAGLARRVAVEITNIADGADYVRHGLGIALLPHFITPDRDDLARLTVTGADLRWPMCLAVPAARAPSAAARALIAMIGQAADEGADLPEGDDADSASVRRER
jgi:DNA-binding transcriptional LysR family regulator